MSDRTKIILRVLLFIGVTILLAYGVYYMIFRPDLGGDTPPTETPTGTGELPSAGESTGEQTPGPGDQPGAGELPIASPVAQGDATLVTRLTEGRVLSPAAGGASAAMYYDPNDGYFYRIQKDGTLERFSDAAFPNASNVLLDDKTTNAVLEFPDGSNILYNFDANRQITMPQHWTEFSFAPGGTDVAAKAIGDEYNSSLVVMSTDGSRAYAVQDMGANADKVTMDWSPSGEFLALSNTGPAQLGFGRRAMLLIDTAGEAPGSVIIDGTNFSPKWDPDGSHLLFSTSNQAQEDRPNLWYVKSSGQEIGAERKSLDVATWAEKCTFKDDITLLCAVPREIQPWEGSSPLYNSSTDDLYEVNVLTGRKKVLAKPTITARMFDLTLSEDNSTVYFTDQEGRLNYIRLQ